MPKNDKDVVPDAWDDDWESLADREAKEKPEPASGPEQPVPMTRAERMAKHAETQRKLWEAAETAEDINFLPQTNPVPLATPFKPTMKLLSRKPAPKVIARKDPVTGLEQLTIQDDEDDEDESKKNQPTPEEIRLRQQRDREEKQRRYDEARAKIFGEPSPSSGQSTPGNVTPPRSNSNEGRQNYRGRGRGRGRGGRGGGGYSLQNPNQNQNQNQNQNDNRQDRDGQSPRSQSNSQQLGTTRELFDPSYAPKPGSNAQRRSGGDTPPQSGRSSTPREEDQIIRAPRGPDASGRGFGFAKREPKEG